jgi:hypothetical protein
MAEKLLENGGATNSNGPILVQDRVANSPGNPAEEACFHHDASTLASVPRRVKVLQKKRLKSLILPGVNPVDLGSSCGSPATEATMAHLNKGMLALLAGIMLCGCVDSTTLAKLQSYHPVNIASQDDVRIIFSNGSDYRTPIKPWFYGN